MVATLHQAQPAGEIAEGLVLDLGHKRCPGGALAWGQPGTPLGARPTASMRSSFPWPNKYRRRPQSWSARATRPPCAAPSGPGCATGRTWLVTIAQRLWQHTRLNGAPIQHWVEVGGCPPRRLVAIEAAELGIIDPVDYRKFRRRHSISLRQGKMWKSTDSPVASSRFSTFTVYASHLNWNYVSPPICGMSTRWF
jgi:hypothetical protein